MDMEKIYRKALALDFLTADEALVLYESGPLDELMSLAWELRQKHVPGRTVTWQIDRNVNITNVCISGCKFCNFHCKPYDRERAYVTTIDQYVRKIDETLALGGDQLLLQGGLHPKLGIDFYENLFREALSHAEAARSRRTRGRPHRPHQLARRRDDAAPADGRRPRFAARSRGRDSR